MDDNLETKMCIWKVQAELQEPFLGRNVHERNYAECHACNGYNSICESYIGETVLAVIPMFRSLKIL